MDGGVDFGLLGPVRALAGGRELALGSRRERFVLALLLLDAGRALSTDALIDEIWADPPATAKAQVHNAIRNVRRRLCEHAPGLVTTHDAAYQLDLGEHRLDVTEFRRLARQAREALDRGDHARASLLATRAVTMWRGPALADVGADLARSIRFGLADERLAVLDTLLDAELALQHYDEVLRIVEPVLLDYPFRENLYCRRMLALIGAGRRADALATYRQAFRRLADELGVEPGPELRRLEERILRGDSVAEGQPSVAPPLPRQLPPLTAALVGRDELVHEVAAGLRAPETAGALVGLLVGPGGVGKTALALTVASELAGDYPDGQVYADLRGTDERPIDPHLVMGRLLRTLGLTGSAVPEDPDERIGVYRGHLSARRILLVLDDAAGESQVRPLLPGERSAALVTSRRPLGAMVGVARWIVPTLTTDAAIELLGNGAGMSRVLDEPAAAELIAGACANLPLAVGIARGRLASRPDLRLADYHQRLVDERRRLDELAIGDLDVRASIALSYRGLGAAAQLLFRRLGLLATTDFPAWVPEQLAETDRDGAVRAWDELIDVHLVQAMDRDPAGQPRFRLHDLVRDFARERALAEDPAADRERSAVEQLTTWLALATTADERAAHGVTLATGLMSPELPPFAHGIVGTDPLAWFEAERTSLVAAVGQAAQLDRVELAGALALRLVAYLSVRTHDDDREQVLVQAVTCARRGGPSGLLVQLLSALFAIRAQRKRVTMSDVAREELDVARRLGEARWELRALTHAGLVARWQGRLGEAQPLLEQAVDAARRPGIPRWLVASTLDGLAELHADCGRLEQAVPLFEEALRIARETGPARRTGMYAFHYARTMTGLGRLDAAERVLTAGLDLVRELGDTYGTAYLECALAAIEVHRGRTREAAARLKHVLHAAEDLGVADIAAEAMQTLGDLAVSRQRWSEAMVYLRGALAVWRRQDLWLTVLQCLARLEIVHAALGDADGAARVGSEVQQMLTDLGLDASSLRIPRLPGYAG